MSSTSYDFIIVGAGPCGASIASRLANTRSKPSVLLIESGGPNTDLKDRIAGERHIFWATSGKHLDYGYKTVPQPTLNGRQIPYQRGKGLGGSTATNLGLWDYGSKPELDEWAKLVGDDVWRWDNARERLKKIENYHNLTPAEFERYVRPQSRAHGTDGPVDVTIPAQWDPCLERLLEAVEAYGLPLNPDVNSDKCIGFGVPPGTIHDGLRVTAASAYLVNKPGNLNILTDSKVTRVLFEGKRAVGVELQGEKKYYSSKDTIICAGSIDTPKLLLLSGVGPAQDLTKHGVSVVIDHPAIGSNLLDHPMIRMVAPVKPGLIPLETIAPMQGAREQWFKDRTGPLATDNASTCHGYLKLDVASYPEFDSLNKQTRNLLSNPRTPAYEFVCRIAPNPTQGGFLWNSSTIMMNQQSVGRVSLQSADPDEPPAIDLNFLSHPYDLRVTVDAVRRTAEFLQSSIIPTDPFMFGPKSTKETDLVDFIKSNLGHLWHAAGTVKMGKLGEPGTCVTPDFRVVGLEGLRVADLSVLPLLPSNHTQSTAYLVGEIAADKLIGEYRLD